MKSGHIFSLFLILISAWWAWTFLVDFFVIKTVFAVIDNYWTAGRLGMTIFTILNNLEIVTATLLTCILAIQLNKNRAILVLFVMSLVIWLIAMFYFTYLTPKIIELTELWYKADLVGLTAIGGVKDIQQEHQIYHNLYIGMDAIKFILLSLMAMIGIWKQEKMF